MVVEVCVGAGEVEGNEIGEAGVAGTARLWSSPMKSSDVSLKRRSSVFLRSSVFPRWWLSYENELESPAPSVPLADATIANSGVTGSVVHRTLPAAGYSASFCPPCSALPASTKPVPTISAGIPTKSERVDQSLSSVAVSGSSSWVSRNTGPRLRRHQQDSQ